MPPAPSWSGQHLHRRRGGIHVAGTLVDPRPKKGWPRGNIAFDTVLGWRFVNSSMEVMGHTDSLGRTAIWRSSTEFVGKSRIGSPRQAIGNRWKKSIAGVSARKSSVQLKDEFLAGRGAEKGVREACCPEAAR